MEIKGVYNKDDNRPGTMPSSSTGPLSTKQVRDEMRNAIANLKAKGIKDWEILNVWSEIAHSQGNYAAADTLASAAYELGKQARVKSVGFCLAVRHLYDRSAQKNYNF